MKFLDYMKDKISQILLLSGAGLLFLLFLSVFHIPFPIQVILGILYFAPYVINFFWEYFRKKNFYTTMLENVLKLEKSYYVLETLEKPDFLEGSFLYEILYEINKSMCEEVKKLELQNKDFKEYIEMWIHEVKIPISSLVLMAHREKFPKSSLEQMKKIADYVEQILYYARCENVANDYFIKEVALSKIISEVALKNKEELLSYKIDLIVSVGTEKVYTDSKWLVFIVNQIVNNSIKYRRQNIKSYLKITAREEEKRVMLILEDNGIGILESDLPRVFEKTFTGYNGHVTSSSTGMGLFIVKSLCEHLGHSVRIESTYQQFTRVTIAFPKNAYYEVLNLTKK